jgi:hypothetical protein
MFEKYTQRITDYF